MTCMLLAYGLCGLRLGMIQLGTHADLATAAAAQNSVEVGLEEFWRGQIRDRRGVSLLAPTVAECVVIIPHFIEDKRGTARRLAAILETDVSAACLEKPGVLPHVPDKARAAAVRDMQEPGVLVLPVRLRYGPGAAAPHVTGHLGKISSAAEQEYITARTGRTYRISDWVGKSGIELYYEGFLRGERPLSFIRAHYDARLLPLPGLDVIAEREDPGRGDVVLTLDARIQRVAERVLAGAEAGALVVSDVRTGDILALASAPDYAARDPVAGVDGGAGDAFYNRATALYQPGSVFKMVVTVAALENGVVAPDTILTCRGEADPLITCWHTPGHGEIDLVGAFAHSCNPYFSRLGLDMGADVLAHYAARLGFADQTVLGYPYTPDPRQDPALIKEPYNLVNASVGQGPVLVTPVQVNALTATIANGGWYITPRLVDHVENQSGETMLSVPAAAPTRVISASTAEVMRDLMSAVTTAGQGRQAHLPGEGSAGKTGSAQVGDTGRVNAWFTGYFPAASPRYALTVLVEEGVSGGVSAAPLFREAAAGILRVERDFTGGS